ncbi:MAG: hypothetical protein ABUL49_01930 [bacterium]
MEDESQSRIAQFIGFGVALIVASLVGFFLAYIGGVARAVQSSGKDTNLFFFCALAVFGFVLGVGLVITGLVLGGKEAFGNNAKKPMQRGGPVYIVACLVMDRKNEPVFDAEMYDVEDLRFYVQVKFADGTAKEFETAYEVMGTIGEGMWGYIVYQGKWLNSFERILVDPQRPQVSQY